MRLRIALEEATRRRRQAMADIAAKERALAGFRGEPPRRRWRLAVAALSGVVLGALAGLGHLARVEARGRQQLTRDRMDAVMQAARLQPQLTGELDCPTPGELVRSGLVPERFRFDGWGERLELRCRGRRLEVRSPNLREPAVHTWTRARRRSEVRASHVNRALQRWRSEGTCPSGRELVRLGVLNPRDELDLWGHRFRTSCAGTSTEVRSAGPNGRWHDDDDVRVGSQL